MKFFDLQMRYFNRHRLPQVIEKELSLTHHDSIESLVSVCHDLTINCLPRPKIKILFNDELIGKVKRVAFAVNPAGVKIYQRDAIARETESLKLCGYDGDISNPESISNEHIWHIMPNLEMTPQTLVTSLSVQGLYASGAREILEFFFEGSFFRDLCFNVKDGELASMEALSYSQGTTTRGLEEVAKFH